MYLTQDVVLFEYETIKTRVYTGIFSRKEETGREGKCNLNMNYVAASLLVLHWKWDLHTLIMCGLPYLIQCVPVCANHDEWSQIR